MRRLLAFVAATGFAGLAMAAPFADMTPDMEYVSPEEMASAIAAAATNQAASAAAVAVAATNHADAVGAAVAQAATNHTDAVGAAVAVAATNYTDAAVASSTNGLLRSESDPVWEREKGGYARTEGDDVTFRPMGDDGGWVKIGTMAGTPYVEIDGTRIYQWTIESGDAAVAAAATNYADRASAGATNALDAAIRARGYLTSHQDISGKADKTAVPGTVSNIVTKAYVEGLGIEAGIDGAGVSNIVTKSYVEGLGIEAGVSGQAVTNIVDGKIAELDIDQESLARAVQVGEDLALIDADTNGWHIAVSNVVETDQAHVHGTLIVGDTIYGAPENGDRIDIDGCDFFYNRQIPGDTTQTNGYGNIVTDPYMEWRLTRFFADYNAETTRMWNQVATINNLPDTLDDDLRTYNSVTSNLEAATMEVNLVRDEVNMTNAVMRAAFDRALAEAASSGEGWSATNAMDECLILTDHGVTTCSASTSSYYIMLPSWTGTPAHCLAWFDNAAAWSDSPPSFYTSSAGAVYVDEALPAEFHAGGGKYLFDFRQLDEDTWFLSVHPAGVGFLGGDAR